MTKDSGDKGFLGGVLGALTVSLFNTISQTNKRETIDYDDYEIIDAFSYSEMRKSDGYELKYDIDESKVKPKYINVLEIGEYGYKIIVENKIMEDSIGLSDPISGLEDIETKIYFMIRDKMSIGIFILDNTKPKYWVYSEKISDKHIKIRITDHKIDENLEPREDTKYRNSFYDDYQCLELEEAMELSKEMKRYYHKYVERVEIVEEFNKNNPLTDDDYDNMIIDIMPNYHNILDMLKDINSYKYNEVITILEGNRFEGEVPMIYTLCSVGVNLYDDNYFSQAVMVLEDLLDIVTNSLNKFIFEDKIYKTLLNCYIVLKCEEKIIDIIDCKYKEDSYFIKELASKLYEWGLYDASDKVYNIIIEASEKGINKLDDWDLYNIYVRIQNDEGIDALRARRAEEGDYTYFIDRYLNDKDETVLKLKIDRFYKEENWNEVINNCNKYSRLVLGKPLSNMDDIVKYNFRKINAYIKLDKSNEVWVSTCKVRRFIICNIDNVNYFKYLSQVENHMLYRQKCLVDGVYHNVLKTVYRDMFIFYTEDSVYYPEWNTNLFIKNIVESEGLIKWWYDVESFIIDEYKNLSESTPRKISIYMKETLSKYGHVLKKIEPKKLFPLEIPRYFDV